MVIPVFGAINSITPNKMTTSQSMQNKNDFATIFSNVIGKEEAEEQSLVESPLEVFQTENELTSLIQFLQTKDVLEMEDGDQLLACVYSQNNMDLINSIAEKLNLTLSELINVLQTYCGKLQMQSEKASTNNGEMVVEREFNQTEYELIVSLIMTIAETPKQDLLVNIDRDSLPAIKALKLFQLLGSNDDSVDLEIKLREFIKDICKQLETVSTVSKVNEKLEGVNKVFQALVNEQNGNSLDFAKDESNALKSFSRLETANSQGILPMQHFSRQEQLRLISDQTKPMTTEQVLEQFTSILSKSQFTKIGDTQRLLLKLNPEHLGTLRIELIQKDTGITARFLTMTGTAKELMETHINSLKHAFHSQNIHIEKVEISQQFTQQFQQNDRDSFREQQQGQERQRKNEEQQEKESDKIDFNLSLEDALLNMEV